MGLLGSSIKGGKGGSDWLDKIMRAYALSQGDIGGAATLSASMRKSRDDAQAAQRAQALQQQALADLVAQGVPENQARLMVLNPEQVGSNMATRLGARTLGPGDTLYNGSQSVASQPTTEQQNFNQYSGMAPEQQQKYLQYKDVTDPRFTNTPAGTQFVPRQSAGGLPQGYDPNEWEPVQGPQQNVAPPNTAFTPDASNMQRLYHQQFGPQQGETMFQEWLRNSRHGGR